MKNFTYKDAIACLKRAENLNAAFKNFLKREVRRGEPAERFVKDFKDVILGREEGEVEAFLAKKLPQFTEYLVGLGGYAHSDFVRAQMERIIERYAERFNRSFTLAGEEITVTDEKTFNEIVGLVQGEVEGALVEHGFAGSDFMRNIVLASLFERPVLKRILAQMA